MKFPFFLGFCFLMLSLSLPHAIAGPFDKKGGMPKSAEEQGRRITDWDDLLQDWQQDPQARLPNSLPTASDPTLQQGQGSAQDEKASLPREQILEELGKAFRQAYARGDETHPHWNAVAELVEKLYPANTEEELKNHIERRYAIGDKVQQAVEAETEILQYHFFHETLPAIKKTSVVAALRAPNRFQTTEMIEKSQEEKEAWRQARISFETVCEEEFLKPKSETDTFDDADFHVEEPFNAYLERLKVQSARLQIEILLNTLHHDIMQNIIEANVCNEGFEERAFNAAKIHEKYQPFLETIARPKEKIHPIVQHKWDAFHQEAMARCLYDATQVEKINFWKNRNRLTPLMRDAERAHWQAEKASPGAQQAAWELAAATHSAALSAWQTTKENLEGFRQHVGDQKSKLGLTILSATEQEIAAALEEAEQVITNMNQLISTIPLKILEAAMNHARDLYQIASEQHQIEKKLKGNGNPALARYTKEKYLGLASAQFGETMRLIATELQAKPELESELREQIEKFEKEFKDTRLSLLIAPLIKSEECVKKMIERTAVLRSAEQGQEADGTSEDGKVSTPVQAFFQAIQDYRPSKAAAGSQGK